MSFSASSAQLASLLGQGVQGLVLGHHGQHVGVTCLPLGPSSLHLVPGQPGVLTCWYAFSSGDVLPWSSVHDLPGDGV